MKKRIKLFLAAAIAAIVSVAAGFYSYQATQENQLAQEQELLIDENVEALTFFEGFFEWLDSPAYDCIPSTCIITVEGHVRVKAGWRVISTSVGGSCKITFEIPYEVPRSGGSEVAHRWNCKACSLAD